MKSDVKIKKKLDDKPDKMKIKDEDSEQPADHHAELLQASVRAGGDAIPEALKKQVEGWR